VATGLGWRARPRVVGWCPTLGGGDGFEGFDNGGAVVLLGDEVNCSGGAEIGGRWR